MSPRLTIICGPNGSGKTTLTRKIMSDGYDLGTYINPDDIAAEMTGTMIQRTREAQAEADQRREYCLHGNHDFCFETVFSHPSKLDFMDRARAAGFEIHVFFISLDDPERSIERVRLRVSAGGHSVPEDRVVDRWHRVMALLPEIVRRSDRAVIFDNSAPPETAAIRPVAEARRRDGLVEIRREKDAPSWVRRYLPQDRLRSPTR